MKKSNKKRNYVSLFSLALLFSSNVIMAAKPLWTFSAPSPKVSSIPSNGSVTVSYTVTNQSNKAKRLFLQPQPAVNTAGECVLPTKGSICQLVLSIDGSKIPAAGINDAPVLCEKGNPNQCYRPSKDNLLNITKDNAAFYSIAGSISGLSANGLVLRNNGDNDLPVASGATSFKFSTPVSFGSNYNVTVFQQPSGQTCTVSNGTGTNVMTNVSNVSVTCTANSIPVFVTNNSANTASRCDVDVLGVFSNCVDSGAGAVFNGPVGIIFNAASTIAFVTNLNSNTINRCDVNATGVLSNCVDSGVGAVFSQPLSIIMNTAQTHVFVTNNSANTVSRCDVSATGVLSNCVDSGAGAVFTITGGIVFNAAQTRAFITNLGAGTVTRCDVSAAGVFSNCMDSGAGAVFVGPVGITFNAAETRIFITNNNTNTVSRCDVSAAGVFSNCVDSGAGAAFNGPGFIVLNTSGTRAFVTNFNTTTVSRCDVSAAGVFSNCADSGAGAVFSSPAGIVFN